MGVKKLNYGFFFLGVEVFGLRSNGDFIVLIFKDFILFIKDFLGLKMNLIFLIWWVGI